MTKVIKEFQLFWRRYLLQSFFATLTIFVVLLLLSLQHAVIVASIGATAFIIFAMPQNITAKPRNVIGGHLVGLLSGFLCSLIPHTLFFYSVLVYSLAVGISIFVMVVVDTEHPPASGTALGVAITGFSLNAVIAVITSIIILSLAHRHFGSHLKCLT
jgi:CBS-domain-containing membrane protein